MKRSERADLNAIHAAYLESLRAEARSTNDASTRAWLTARIALCEGRAQDALEAFDAARSPHQPGLGRACALARLGRSQEAQQLFEAIGFWCDGGNLEGHVLSAHAFLGRFPPTFEELLPALQRPPSSDHARRVSAAARTAPKATRLALRAALAEAQGRVSVAYKQAKLGLRDRCAAEACLAVQDFDLALDIYTPFRKGSGSSWFRPQGDLTKAFGYVGSAAALVGKGEYTRALGYVDKALALDKKSPGQALLVGYAAALALGLSDRATRYRARLRRVAPLVDLTLGGLRLSELDDEYGRADARLEAAAAGDEAWEDNPADAIEPYERALALGRRVRAKIAFGGRREAIAARLLWAHCTGGTHTRALAIANACIAANPDFANGFAAAAWAAYRLKDRQAAAIYFRDAGLRARWDDAGIHGGRQTVAAWARRAAEEVLSPDPQSRLAHAGALVEHGHRGAALEIYEAYPLASNQAERFYAAYVRWVPFVDVTGSSAVGRRYGKRATAAAGHAWEVLEPLLKARWDLSYLRQPFDPWILAIELLHVLGDWKRLIQVAKRAASEWSEHYPQVHVGVAGFVADALLRTKGADAAGAHLEGLLKTWPRNRILLESLDAVCRRARRPRPNLEHAVADSTAEGRRLALCAWRAEASAHRDDRAKALALYRASSLAAYDAMGLSNAANLLQTSKRAGDYWRVALLGCADVGPRRRLAGFLGKLAWRRWLRNEPRAAIPIATVGFEIHATRGLADTLERCFAAVGDHERAAYWAQRKRSPVFRRRELTGPGGV
ncbi:MAG: hypothetical protein AAGE52_24610 [Myxococcota bacterium]